MTPSSSIYDPKNAHFQSAAGFPKPKRLAAMKAFCNSLASRVHFARQSKGSA